MRSGLHHGPAKTKMSAFERGRPDTIETAGIDELRALQLNRLKDSLARANGIFPTPGEIRRSRRRTVRREKSRRSRKTSIHHQGRSAAGLSVRHVRGADERDRARACLERHPGKPTVVAIRAAISRLWAMLIARSIRAAGGRPGDKMHVAYGYGLFTGGLGAALRRRISRLHRHPDQQRLHRAPGSAHLRFRARHHRGDAVLSARHCRRIRPSRRRRTKIVAAHRAVSAPSHGPRRCGAEIERRMGLDAVNVYGLSEVIGPGVGQEYAASKDGLTIWKTTSSRDHRPGHRQSAAGR